MPDAKRTKRTRSDADGLTLDDHIARKREELVRRRRQAPELRARASALRADAAALTARWQRRRGLDLVARAVELEEEARARESMAREHAFEATTVAYLRLYYEGTERGATRRASRVTDELDACAGEQGAATTAGESAGTADFLSGGAGGVGGATAPSTAPSGTALAAYVQPPAWRRSAAPRSWTSSCATRTMRRPRWP